MLVAVLDALRAPKRPWSSVQIEPNTADQKADIVWTFADGARKAVQVKSSINPFELADVTTWGKQLESDRTGCSELELVLLGVFTKGVAKAGVIGGVAIPNPRPADVLGSLRLCADALDRWMDWRGIGPTPPTVRDLLVDALATKLLVGATMATVWTPDDLDAAIRGALLLAYPAAITVTSGRKPVALWDFAVLALWDGHPDRVVVTRVGFANDTDTAVVIEWILIRIRLGERVWQYIPRVRVNESSFHAANFFSDATMGLGHFGEFAVGRSAVVDMMVAMMPDTRAGFESGCPVLGEWDMEFYAKYRGVPTPTLEHSYKMAVDPDVYDRMTMSGGAIRLLRHQIVVP